MELKLQSLLFFFAGFLASAYGYELDCSFMQTDWGMSVGNRFGAYCTLDTADNDFINLAQVTGDPSGHQLSDVQYLQVTGSGSTTPGPARLPANLKTIFPDIVSLTWTNAGLQYLSASDLSSWTNLLQVSFTNNHLRSLDANLFSHNPKLQSMDFSSNPIDVIGDGFFLGLNKLTQITFMSAKCLGMNYMGSLTNIEAQERDIQHLCGPLTPEGDKGECAADCEGLFSKAELTLTGVDKKKTADLKTLRDRLYQTCKV